MVLILDFPKCVGDLECGEVPESMYLFLKYFTCIYEIFLYYVYFVLYMKFLIYMNSFYGYSFDFTGKTVFFFLCQGVQKCCHCSASRSVQLLHQKVTVSSVPLIENTMWASLVHLLVYCDAVGNVFETSCLTKLWFLVKFDSDNSTVVHVLF